MSANFLHGVETIELDSGARAITGVKSAVIGIVGTAPLYEIAAADQKVNEPVLIQSQKDAATYFGSGQAGFTISQALDAIFDQGKGIAIVVNVLDPDTHKSDVTGESKTFGTDDTMTLAHRGVSSVVVTHTTGTPTYVLDTDYSLNAITGVITRLDGSIAEGQTVLIDYSWVDPSLVLSADIIGTVDGNGNRTGMQAWKDSYNLFGFFPKILIAPEYCETDSVAAEMDVLAEALRAICIVDAPHTTTYAGAITGRGPSGTINFYHSSDRMVLCFPHVKRYDLIQDATVLEGMSARVAGVIAARDVEKGYWWSPSNAEIKGITGVEIKLTAMINDPTSEVNLLNENGIMTLFNSFGTGIRTWGNRSSAYPSVTTPIQFIPVRRVADMIHESVEYSMLQFIDFPINQALIDAITESVNGFIRTLVGRGAVLDGKCWYDTAKNPAVEIAAGHLTFDIEYMPPIPAERITFESYINTDYLKNLGGE
jgi:uncharacterized protein